MHKKGIHLGEIQKEIDDLRDGKGKVSRRKS